MVCFILGSTLLLSCQREEPQPKKLPKINITTPKEAPKEPKPRDNNTKENYQEELKKRFQFTLERAADKVLYYMIKTISPQSGRNAQRVLWLDNIVYDEKENIVGVNARFIWEARDFWKGIPYDQCIAQGAIYVYLKQRDIDTTRVRYIHTEHNTHMTAVANSKDLQAIVNGFTLDLD